MSDTKPKDFPKGLMVKPGRTDFVKMEISIKIADLQAYLSTKQTEWLNIDVKESKEGKLYTVVNDWKKAGKQDSHNQAKADGYAPAKAEFNDDLIPF